MTSPDTSLPPALADGRYEPLALIGEGGMAQVYRVRDRRLSVERAVKLLDPRFTKRGSIRKRFLVEARTMARLSHPHIVRVQDIVADDDRIFIVMDLITGGTVWDRVESSGPYPADEARLLVAAVADAVATAHAAGVIHRDIKPQNILLDDEGRPLLTDFGIALVGDDVVRRNATRTGTVMGTWGFMSPEQRADAHRVDERADVYGLGATLWSMLRGRTPTDLFAAEMEPSILDGIPGPLAELIRRSTRYRPDDRIQSAGELGALLRSITLTDADMQVRSAIVHGADAPATVHPTSGYPGPSSPGHEPTSETLVGFLDEPEPEAPPAPPSRRLLVPALVAFSLATSIALIFALLPSPTPDRPPPDPLARVAPPGPAVVTPPAPVAAPTTPAPQPAATAPEEPPASTPPPTTSPSPRVPAPAGPPETRPTVAPVEPDPPPAEPPPPEEPPAVEPATVSVDGEVQELWLVDDSGDPTELGSVAPGRYTVHARFAGQTKAAVAGVITLHPGQRYTLHCDPLFKGCK
jgi:serine/threonine-protein kinase